jgi:hypothetical protein
MCGGSVSPEFKSLRPGHFCQFLAAGFGSSDDARLDNISGRPDALGGRAVRVPSIRRKHPDVPWGRYPHLAWRSSPPRRQRADRRPDPSPAFLTPCAIPIFPAIPAIPAIIFLPSICTHACGRPSLSRDSPRLPAAPQPARTVSLRFR